MSRPILYVVSLRYSSWSMRALLPLLHAGVDVEVKTVTLEMARQGDPEPEVDADHYVRTATERLAARRALGSVTGYFPVLNVEGEQIHEALAICEWAAEHLPPELRPYAGVMKASPAVTRWRELALRAPAIPIYDDYIRGMGGEVVVPPM